MAATLDRPGDKPGAGQRRLIIKTALILSALTALEFAIAFTWEDITEAMGMQRDTGLMIKNATFMILTVFKAFYIVAEFMHMKYEIKRLIYTILVPFIFIVWLIIALIYEGGSWGALSPGPVETTSIEEVDLRSPALDERGFLSYYD